MAVAAHAPRARGSVSKYFGALWRFGGSPVAPDNKGLPTADVR
jgi:hypothetical protein